jgi:hypothetical protein
MLKGQLPRTYVCVRVCACVCVWTAYGARWWAATWAAMTDEWMLCFTISSVLARNSARRRHTLVCVYVRVRLNVYCSCSYGGGG